jgi:glycosyltransferase involved in cell wall biosynthesis
VKTVLSLIETGGPGGAETVCLELLRGLDPARWRGLAVVPYEGWLSDRLRENGIETHVLPERRSLDLSFLRRVASLVRRRRVDLVHGHLFGSSARAGLLSRLTGVPAIGTLHGIADLASAERFLALKVALLRHGLARVVFVSDPLRDEFLRTVRYPASRSAVIPNGIDAERFAVSPSSGFRTSIGVPEDAFVVGSVGNLNAAKGFDVLLRAAALLKARAPGCRIVIVGDSQGRQSAELLSLRDRLGLADDVLFTGFRSEIAQALASFDVYALTSRSEGFSLSLVEAMAAGLPVVATRCGGPEQIVSDGRTGLLVENGSAEAVAQAIQRLRDDGRLAASLGEAARAAVRERFTVRAQVEAYQRLYDECVAERRTNATPALDAVSQLSR